MPKTSKRDARCPRGLYSQLQRSVTSSFLCTGDEFWDPCPEYPRCLARELQYGVPEPHIPAEPKRPFVSEAA